MFLCPARIICRLISVLAAGGILLAAGCQRPPREDGTSSSRLLSGELKSAPRHDLSQDEEAGGHTLRRHVGRSDDQLRERLQREPNIAVTTLAAALTRHGCLTIAGVIPKHGASQPCEGSGGIATAVRTSVQMPEPVRLNPEARGRLCTEPHGGTLRISGGKT